MSRIILDPEEAEFTFAAAMASIDADEDEKAKRLKIMARATEILAKDKR